MYGPDTTAALAHQKYGTFCVTERENNWAIADVKLNDDCAKAKNAIVFPVRVHAVVMKVFHKHQD